MPYQVAVPGCWPRVSLTPMALNCQPLSFWKTYVTLSLSSLTYTVLRIDRLPIVACGEVKPPISLPLEVVIVNVCVSSSLLIDAPPRNAALLLAPV